MPAKPGNDNAKVTGHTSQGGKFGRTLTYNAWRCMKERCQYDKHRWFNRYGGRGITICERWLGKEGYVNFLADMGERPSKAHTVDRENSDGNYEPTNCKWATKKEQFDNIERPFGKERTNGEQGNSAAAGSSEGSGGIAGTGDGGKKPAPMPF